MVFKFHTLCFTFILSMLLYIQPNSSDMLVKRMYKDAYFRDTVRRKPIVMIPGVLGSQLQAKLHRKHSAWWLCSKTSDWFDIWLNIRELTPLSIDCWVDDIKLLFNNKTGGIQNQEGVEIRTTHFGSTEAFEYLDKDEYAPGSPYFNKLVDAMVKLGYKKGDDLKGAPFDWRITPSLSSLFLTNVTNLIERNYYEHSNMKVVIIGHSMGNLFIQYMLKNLTQSWKDKFIDSFISINGPYIGSVKALKAITSGEAEGHDILLPKLKLRSMSRTIASSYMMLPRPEYWPKNKRVVVDTFSKNYTVDDYEHLLKRIGCKNCWELWKKFGKEMGDLAAPKVEVHCVYSSQVPTAEVLLYDPDLFPDGTPTLITGDGDGTVNTFSSSYCLKWRSEQNEYVHDVLLPGNDHVKMLNNVTLHNYITKVVTTGFK